MNPEGWLFAGICASVLVPWALLEAAAWNRRRARRTRQTREAMRAELMADLERDHYYREFADIVAHFTTTDQENR